MEIGAIFPQTELSADPGAIREFVQAVEAMGYANLFVADHVLGRTHSSIITPLWRAIPIKVWSMSR